MSSVLTWLPPDGEVGLWVVPAMIVAKVTLLFSIAWLLNTLFASRNPRWRVLLWRSTSIGSLLLIGSAALPSFFDWAILPARPEAQSTTNDSVIIENKPITLLNGHAVEPEEDTLIVADESALSPFRGDSLPADHGETAEVVPSAIAIIADDQHPPVSADAPPASVTQTTIGWWFALWLSGALVLFARSLYGHFSVRRIVRRAKCVDDWVMEDVADACRRLGCALPVDVRRTADLPSPCLARVFRPVVLLPEHQCEPNRRDELGAILAHEIAHLTGRDLQWNSMLNAMAVLFWFHPLAWRMRSAHAAACDCVADAVAAEYVGDVADYSRTLARLAVRMSTRAPSTALAMARTSDVRRRIEALQRQLFRACLPRTRVVAALGAAAIAVAVLGGVALTRAQVKADLEPVSKESTEQSEPEAASKSVDEDAKVDFSDGQNVENEYKTAANDAKPEFAQIPVTGVCKNEDGAVISGASVSVYGWTGPNDKVRWLAQAGTDKLGRFELEFPRPKDATEARRWVHLLSVSKDFHTSDVRWLSRQDADFDFEFQLRNRPEPLKGRVVDETGRPRAGVWVYYPNAFDQPFPNILSDLTDYDGRFEIKDSSREFLNNEDTRSRGLKFGLGLLHPDFPLQSILVPIDEKDIELQLRTGGLVTGTVFDAVTGKPAADRIVSAQGTEEGGWCQTQTNDRGEYRLRMLADAYNIWAEAPDRMPIALDSFEVKHGKTHAAPELRLVRGGYVTGRVLDAETLQPVSPDRLKNSQHINVAHHGAARPRSGAAVASAAVGADGTYRLHVAPGENYVYLMSPELAIESRSNDPNSDGTLNVTDGETVELDFLVVVREPPDFSQSEVQPTPKPRKTARTQAKRKSVGAMVKKRRRTAKQPQARQWPDTKVGRLLALLEKQPSSSDEWAGTMRELILLGPDAVPELAALLDATPASEGRPLRAIPFVLRGIGDKRAIPALIRTIPRCYGNHGSDCGYRAKDPELLRFMQFHDNTTRDDDDPLGDRTYNYSRPTNEVFRTLEKWTGEEFGWKELVFMTPNTGSRDQGQLKKKLFNDCALRWADWWKTHWREYVDDPELASVSLPSFEYKSIAAQPDLSVPLERGSGIGNSNIQPFHDTGAIHSFCDIDTGRWGTLPSPWNAMSRDEIEKAEGQIVAWAEKEGFDLMGMERTIDGKPTYLIRPIKLHVIELPASYRNEHEGKSFQDFIAAGRPVNSRVLVHYDEQAAKYHYDAPAVFAILTPLGTMGMCSLGVQVKDTNVVPGRTIRDGELNPKGFRLGRRFRVRNLIPQTHAKSRGTSSVTPQRSTPDFPASKAPFEGRRSKSNFEIQRSKSNSD